MEEVSILKVDTGEAVKSINDLKENIKILKGQLGELTIGSEEYKDKLSELSVNHNALKDAMHATSASMEDVAASAKGINVVFDENNQLINQSNQSYNSLVHTMAQLKEEWRATTDEARRTELTEQISQINSRLKEMDANVGDFSRKVGNYESGFAGIAGTFEKWGSTLKQMPPTLGAAKESIGKVGETMQLVEKQPILGIIGLLAPIIMKITESLKENETAMGAVKNLMASLQPIFDVLQGVLEGIAQGISKAVEWFVELIGQGDALNTLVEKATGVGNALLQYMLTPIRTIIEAFKGLGNIMKDIFTGEFSKIKEDAAAAWEGIKEGFKEGFSFKENFEEGEAKGAAFVEGMKANREAAKAAGKETAESFKEGMKEVEFDEDADAERAQADEDAYLAEMEAERLREEEKNVILQEGILARIEAKEAEKAALQQAEDELTQAMMEDAEERKAISKAEAEAEKKIKTQGALATAGAVADILNTIADSMDANNEKEFKRQQGLQIAAATINTIAGSVGAFMQAAATIPPPAGLILGAVQAAAVTAAGIAQIATIKKQKYSKGGGSSSSSPSSASASAVASAPNVDTALPSVRNVTSASEEERLNRMASPQKVYILQSDIEAAGEQSKTEVAESSF